MVAKIIEAKRIGLADEASARHSVERISTRSQHQRTSTSLWGEWMGVMHGDEIEYVFGHPLNLSLQFNSRERELSLKIMQAFARFAVTGKPVTDDVNWPLYTKEQPQYFIFNAEKNGIGRGPRATACAFWNNFLPKLRDNPGTGSFFLCYARGLFAFLFDLPLRPG
ncbi:unnamed protein product [Brassicogethes aeneus]|uniref:Carboxylesterase type B domain-containing protein n=1 Tax=Brassicogethes aeneus TaxID=1431903 RepID=A0A9P0BCA5_BRAAE|nr:unnamed protein product [Brassicogethes aeneus]